MNSFSVICLKMRLVCCFREISELVLENEKKSKDLNRLKSEAKDLQSRNDVLDMSVYILVGEVSNFCSRVCWKFTCLFFYFIRINEWRLEENKDTGSVYTFLYKTMFLRLVYEKNTGEILGLF